MQTPKCGNLSLETRAAIAIYVSAPGGPGVSDSIGNGNSRDIKPVVETPAPGIGLGIVGRVGGEGGVAYLGGKFSVIEQDIPVDDALIRHIVEVIGQRAPGHDFIPDSPPVFDDKMDPDPNGHTELNGGIPAWVSGDSLALRSERP